MIIEIEYDAVICLIENYGVERLYDQLKKYFGEGKELLFSEPIFRKHGLGWKLPGEGWHALSEGKEDWHSLFERNTLDVQVVRKELNERMQMVRNSIRTNQKLAQLILTIPAENFIYYKFDNTGNLLIRLVAWGYKYRERISAFQPHPILSSVFTYESMPEQVDYRYSPDAQLKQVSREEDFLKCQKEKVVFQLDSLKKEFDVLRQEIVEYQHANKDLKNNREHRRQFIISTLDQLEYDSINWQRWQFLKKEILSIHELSIRTSSILYREQSVLSYLLNKKKLHCELKEVLSGCLDEINHEESLEEQRFNNLREKCKNLEDIISHKESLSHEIEEKLNMLNEESKKIKVDVYSSVFAPAEVSKKSHMLVQVYLHLYEETEKVKVFAQESDKNAERRDYIPLQCKLKKGDKVDVQLNIYGETLLMSDKKSVVWRGSFTKCSFDYFVPKDIDVDELSCVAMLTVNGVPVGEMRFLTRIVDAPLQLNPEIIAHKYNKVFISYSHQDESKVKFLHEGLELGAVPHFFDRKYLKAGDVFPQVIQDYINSADLFVLCWSENASKSEYVQKERLQALERAFPQVKPEQEAKLRIYPISIEPRAELPGDMKENYHFGEI